MNMVKKVQKGEYLEILLRSKKTIFSTKDVSLLWGEAGGGASQVRLNYYVNTGKLIRIRRGLYAKDKNYDKYELATSILRPSYVSFETVLGSAGITFQYYSQIFVASYVKRSIVCDGQEYTFRKINKTILINPAGIDQGGEYSIASKERAFLDTIYRSKDYHFDNLSPLDWDKVFEILPIYGNKRMSKKAQKYYKYYKANK
jgi:predicted transcriptional regulator of viral defense system